MTTMLEKAARAAEVEIERQISPQISDHKAGKWGASYSHFSGSSTVFGTCQINGEVCLRSVVRAVLMAVRNGGISDNAYSAYSLACETGYSPDYYHVDENGFKAMIDAIIAGDA